MKMGGRRRRDPTEKNRRVASGCRTTGTGNTTVMGNVAPQNPVPSRVRRDPSKNARTRRNDSSLEELFKSMAFGNDSDYSDDSDDDMPELVLRKYDPDDDSDDDSDDDLVDDLDQVPQF